jgi:hypothetical protein
LDAQGGEAEAYRGLGGEGRADEPSIGDLGQEGEEDPESASPSPAATVS